MEYDVRYYCLSPTGKDGEFELEISYDPFTIPVIDKCFNSFEEAIVFIIDFHYKRKEFCNGCEKR